MSELLDPDVHIYQGIWTNWTRGRVYGLTWTLSPTKSTLLTNTLALFVALAGGQLWNIIRFGIHQIRASCRSEGDSDESRTQQQVVLRNTDTDLGTLRLMLQLAWHSRNTSKQLSFPILIATLAILHYALFMLAGTFSTLASAGPAVLARSKFCGVRNITWDVMVSQGIDPTSFRTIDISQHARTDVNRNIELSLEYARECYKADAKTSSDPRCDGSIKSQLDFHQRTSNATCPFAPEMCFDDLDSVVFDTQDIDSHEDLGINAPVQERLTYRRRTTCTVLNDTGHVTESAPSTPLNIAYANYGYSTRQDKNWTYSYSNFSALYTEFTPQTTNPYMLNPQLSYAPSPSVDRLGYTSFEVIPALRQRSGDLILLFLSFTGRYFQPIDDPWFAAHQLHYKNTSAPIARIQYSRDKTVSTVGCIEQHQFCNPRTQDCTAYLGWGQIQDVKSFRTSLSPHQSVTFNRIIAAIDFSGLAQVTIGLAYSSSPLSATDYCATQSTVLSLKLPDNQWQIELKRWHSIALAQLQRTVVQWGTGRNVPDPRTQLVPARTEPDRWFCSNMMIRSRVYQSFSVFTLLTIVGAGVMIIVISVHIERIARCVEAFVNPDSKAGHTWAQDHILRLKRSSIRASWKPQPPPKDHRLLRETRVGGSWGPG